MSESVAKVRTGRTHCPDCGNKLTDTDFPCHDYCKKCKKLVSL